MRRTTQGIAALCLSTALAATPAAEKKGETEIFFSDIPQVCQDKISGFGSFATDYESSPMHNYKVADTSSTPTIENTPTYVFERRIWREPKPTFADSARMECRWTGGGNIYFSYEEPSPIQRPENYHGQDSYLVEYSIYSADGKTLLEQEVVERDFGQPALWTLTEELREGKHHTNNPTHGTYVTGKVASEITDVNPETGALIVDYARRNPSKGKIHFYVTSRHLKTENGVEYRVLERFQHDMEQSEINDPENFHMVYATDARGNITYIEKDTYDFSETSESVFKLEKTTSLVKEFKYTTGIKFEGHNVFDEALITRKDPETGACLSQVHIDYHYDLNGSEKPIYWKDITKIPCPSKKAKKKAEEPETTRTKFERVTWNNLPELSATAEIERALIFPGELMAFY